MRPSSYLSSFPTTLLLKASQAAGTDAREARIHINSSTKPMPHLHLLLLCCPLLSLLVDHVADAFLLPSSSLPASRHPSPSLDTPITTSTALYARKKRTKEKDWMEVLKESGGLEEKEEGIWPTAPAPWEASFVGTSLDPLMLDPDDFDEEELGMMAMLEEEESDAEAKDGEEEEEEEGEGFVEEQDVELSLGYMDYREDDE
ncbi:hypothetical protein VYU27_009898, partial [Nannochloropsis oceanica]